MTSATPNTAPHRPQGRRRTTPAIWAGVLLAAGVLVWLLETVNLIEFPWSSRTLPPPPAPVPIVDEATVRQLCTQCHQFPEPGLLPRSAWQKSVSEMVTMPGYGTKVKRYVNPQSVIRWYEKLASETLTLEPLDDVVDPTHPAFERFLYTADVAGQQLDHPLMIANVRLLDVLGDDRDGRPEIVACDMANGLVLMGRPDDPARPLEVIARRRHPAHVDVVDLDGDGRRDLLLANLGSFGAIDHNRGQVEWLRNLGGGRFEPITLVKGLSRVSDARAADFDDDGDFDLVVAEFGWRRTGRVLLFENTAARGNPPSASTFRLKQLDARHGAIHVEIIDLNDDGLLDFVALISQEHEAVVAFINDGDLSFTAQTLYQAPHPNWGSSGIELVDLNGDGLVDVLVTNGDTMDDARLKSDHGIRWLENTGGLSFRMHHLARLYGVHRAEAGDIDGDGDLDIVACGFVGPRDDRDAELRQLKVPSVLWLEQTAPGQFTPRALEAYLCNHPTLCLGDTDGDGRVDLLLGNYTESESPAPVELWRNITRPR